MPTTTVKPESGDMIIVGDFIGFVVKEDPHNWIVTDGEVERNISKTANVQIITNAYAYAHLMYKRLKGVQ